MRGRIGFESAPGVGTTFHIDIPERRPEAVEAPTPFEGPRVLIVEDEPDVSSMLLTMLGDSGFAPVRAHSASQSSGGLLPRT